MLRAFAVTALRRPLVAQRLVACVTPHVGALATFPGVIVKPSWCWHQDVMFSSRIQVSPEDAREVEKFLQNFSVNSIPKSDMDLQFARSSGPGGQNVNKVNSKVELRFNLDQVNWIPKFTKAQMRKQEHRRISKDGMVLVTSERHRMQPQNQEDCFQKLFEMIVRCSKVPKETAPETKEKISKIQHTANQKRMNDKKMRSERKSKAGWRD